MPSFTIGDADFLLDGEPHRILSGAIHYFRVHPDDWADRIRKARLMGLNAVETYVAWNAHEPVRGEWDATGANDLARFLDLVAAEGMHAMVRPGPYICAEWHNGGLPVWLTGMDGVGLRRSEPQYLEAVSGFLRRVYEIVVPRQIDRGGPVILVQIENEYGAYGDDADYLEELVRLTREAGVVVPLTTVDQPQPDMLRNGSLPTLHRTGSFGSQAAERLATLREHQPTGPLMCSEFWDGWFDWWGGAHHTTSAADSARELDTLLAAGASVNIYMFHGGTNSGLTNGANDKGRYLPITTSYDYDSPLDEAGDPTEKYEAFREVIARYSPVPAEAPAARADRPAFTVPLASTPVSMTDAVALAVEGCDEPPTFDQLGRSSGLVRYTASLPAGGVLVVGEVRDRAWVAVDGVRVGILSRTRHDRAIAVPAGDTVELLVEEQGRVNYADRLGEPKGLIGGVTLDGVPLRGWAAQPIDLDRLAASALSADAESAHGPVAGPAVLRTVFALAEATDLFLDTAGWGTGFAFVNGFALGRYAATGPQRTLYVPRPVVRAGENTLVVVELEAVIEPAASFVPGALLGDTEE
ncbi:glycoside hydrolase family 35 protein [Microbacterium rhizosphaerae]|uniref:Glycoside hydrolase family 35 protein n=1 Tax=Microbacterium rhizosphaerae TaxID=1678237 RepID=A0ABZ0SM65_9MICO|nr:glycoside hydrolase family 35 protein [Microbacterium rhizosphaerae]WPR90476.1 glycoside hydrolase family 35 protein [Microbacterium rhizosphaerae]